MRDESHYLWGRYDLLPLNRRAYDPKRSHEVPPIYRDDDIYESYKRYPGELARMGDMIVQRGVGMVRIFIYPVQYYPRSERIEVYTKICFEIQCAEGFDYGRNVMLSRHASERTIAEQEREIGDFVMNPEEVEVIPFEWSEEQKKDVRCVR